MRTREWCQVSFLAHCHPRSPGEAEARTGWQEVERQQDALRFGQYCEGQSCDFLEDGCGCRGQRTEANPAVVGLHVYRRW